MRRGLGSLIWGGWYHFSPGYTTEVIKDMFVWWKLKTNVWTSEVNTNPALSVVVAVNDDTSTTAALELDLTQLTVSEPASEPTATDAVLKTSLLAPFSRLQHLNLAQNKVPYQRNILFLSFHTHQMTYCTYALWLCNTLPPLGHIWDVMLIWRKGILKKNCLCITVLDTIIMVHTAQRYEQFIQVDRLAWFSSLFSERLSVSLFSLHGAI